MTNIPFENQRLPVNLVEQIEHDITQGKGVSGDVLLGVLEQSVGHQLDDRLRKVIRTFSVSAVKRRGRPCSSKGPEDFALRQVDARYPALLQKYQGEARQRRHSAAAEGSVLPSAERTPSELAYTKIQKMKGVKAVFPNIGWLALRNLHCAWNRVHFHSAENHIESDDYDAEIARLFPAPRES
jgi:hypothetical protein